MTPRQIRAAERQARPPRPAPPSTLTISTAPATATTQPAANSAASALAPLRRIFSAPTMPDTLCVAAFEDQNDFDRLLQDLRQEHQSATPTENILIDSLAQHEWFRRRAVRLVDAHFCSADGVFELFPELSMLMRYQAANERGFSRCLAELRKLRADRRQTHIGFESQKWREADQTRMQEQHTARLRLANARAKHVELDSEIRQAVQAPLPGHTAISIELLTSTFRHVVEEVNRELAEKKAGRT